MLVSLILGDKLSDERKNNTRKTGLFINVSQVAGKTALELLAKPQMTWAAIATSLQMVSELIVKQIVCIMPYFTLDIIRRVDGGVSNVNLEKRTFTAPSSDVGGATRVDTELFIGMCEGVLQSLAGVAYNKAKHLHKAGIVCLMINKGGELCEDANMSTSVRYAEYTLCKSRSYSFLAHCTDRLRQPTRQHTHKWKQRALHQNVEKSQHRRMTWSSARGL